jgi:AcrR family transcriptional regulator
MSGNLPQKSPSKPSVAKKLTRKIDPRVKRTSDSLGDALVALMHEKPFEEITVQHVLDRAGVSRSTFYTHYRDKDDLFISDVEDFFEQISSMLERRGEDSDRVAPVQELFAHVSDAREFYAALVASGKVNDTLEMGRGCLARGIERRLSLLPRARAIAPASRAAMAHGLSGALFSLLAWWIDHGMSATPSQMDAMFHHMVWRGMSVPART